MRDLRAEILLIEEQQQVDMPAGVNFTDEPDMFS